MKIFEFAFNPKKRKDRFFEVFSYEPKRPKEKQKGSLYIVGELTNALHFNSRFLRRLSIIIQSAYYDFSLKGISPALKDALKKANGFLTHEQKKGNVDWLGNLHIAVLLFVVVKEKKTVFHLAKAGNIKVHMARKGSLVDIGKNLETSSSRQPGKMFGNVVSGSLVPDDSVLVENKEVFDVLSREKALSELGTFKEAKQFREFFAKRSRMLSQVSGVVVSVVIEEETPKLMLKKGVKIPMPKLKLEFPWMRNLSAFKKQAKLVLLLFALLLLGWLIF